MKKLILAVMAMAALDVFAAERFAYKGRLAKSDGSVFNITLPMKMTFRIYSGDTGGTTLWGRILPVRLKADGSFNVELGDNEGSPVSGAKHVALADALAESTGGAWIGLTPGEYSEMSPRQRLNPVPRALHTVKAAHAQTVSAPKVVADSLTVAQDVNLASLTLKDGGTMRQTSNDAKTTLTASGERTISAGVEIRVTGEIEGINVGTHDADYIGGKGVAPCDAILVWRKADGITGEGWTSLVVPKSAKLDKRSNEAVKTTSFGRGL